MENTYHIPVLLNEVISGLEIKPNGIYVDLTLGGAGHSSEIAKKLSEGIPFVRVDLYSTVHQPYFGELTFYPASGFGVFTPKEWDEKLGEMINLPKKR